MLGIRKPAVAGAFYPAEARRLERMIEGFMPPIVERCFSPPKAVIAPHAGYVYSGPVAASVYALLRPVRDIVRRVVLVGPAHRVEFHGVAVPTADAFKTPLGTVPVDRQSVQSLSQRDDVVVRDDAHQDEHGLEVHLPFLQRELTEFRIVPLLVGDAPYETVAELLRELWDGPETLIVISSDLSHYYPYDQARAIDAETARAIESLDPDAIGPDQACGRIGIQALLKVAREKRLHATRLDLRNSGDTAGPREQVVGYGAFAFD